jgi:cytochrome c oxidase assembly factor CtaG/ferredoxin
VSPTLDAFLRSWTFDPWLLATFLVSAGVYLRGWLVLHRRNPLRWHNGKPIAFLGGLAAIYLALASPIEAFAGLLVQVHMIQHLLLTMAAPPLLWLGEPLIPVLRGLPRAMRVYWVGPFLSSVWLRRLFGRLTHPMTALPVFVAITWIWHVPPAYELALRSSAWHYVQHVCFLAAGLLFWYPVIQPYPARPRWSRWLLLPHLFLADLSNTALSALLTFSNRVLYPHYAEVPRLDGLSALADQSVAGVIMWVPGSLAFLLPLFALGVQLLSGPQQNRQTGKSSDQRGTTNRFGVSRSLTNLQEQPVATDAMQARAKRQADSRCQPLVIDLPFRASPGGARIPLPLITVPGAARARSTALREHRSGFDLLRLPLVGRFLKWRHARLCLQLPLLLLAGLVIYDGLSGPQVGAMNLAGVLPWIHWRGLVAFGLLVAGNVFCMGCPFLLPRTIARRWLPARWTWPRRLRSKWLALLVIVAFLWAYEALALWDRPAWTAGLALSYFAGALVIDGLFRGGSFCKYVCPIGQFNFVQSLVSPLEVKAIDPDVCASCRTKDCIRGRDGIPGCELNLYLPRKASNMDCTTCLDCVHACPHDNVGLIAGSPGAELWSDRQRSGVGRFSRRPDLAALVLALVFGAFANAAGMVAPVVEAQAWLMQYAGLNSPLLPTTAFYLLALVVLPLVAAGGAAALSRRWGRLDGGTLRVATRYTFALVPLGFGMWLAHYSFHFLTSYDAAVPVAQRLAADLGATCLGRSQWAYSCCRPVADWLLPLEILFLDLGLLLSLYTGYRLALAESPRPLRALAPWALLLVILFVVGLWILFQPMEMRGTLS